MNHEKYFDKNTHPDSQQTDLFRNWVNGIIDMAESGTFKENLGIFAGAQEGIRIEKQVGAGTGKTRRPL